MVLLDSEGIDAASSVGYDDNQIFTLTVLLASVLIYNSQGVPMRRDLEGLKYPLLTLLYPYSLPLRFEQFLAFLIVCLFASAFLGGDKSTEKGGALIHPRHPTDEQLRRVDIYFLATKMICSLSTLN